MNAERPLAEPPELPPMIVALPRDGSPRALVNLSDEDFMRLVRGVVQVDRAVAGYRKKKAA
ncbi:MAG: hypothetical protein AABM30_11745 [Actinomycetota bacterium]